MNYVGQALILDVDDVTYTVPGTDTHPQGGLLALSLTEGEHKYAAQIPGVPLGSAGEFTIAGNTIAKAAQIIETPATIDHRGIVIALPQNKVDVFDFDPLAAAGETSEAVAPVDDWQPIAAAAGKGSLVWINHYQDTLTVDLQGTIYTVPAASSDIPGRLQVDLAPGSYRYTASVPFGSLNHEVSLTDSEIVGLNISAQAAAPPEFDLNEPSPLPQAVTLQLFQEMLSAAVTTVTPETVSADTPPATLPNTGGDLPTFDDPSDVRDTVLITNYTADTLTFTVNDQVYTIESQATRPLALPPGSYDYTASLPFFATTGNLQIDPRSEIDVSIALTPAGNALAAYHN
ncbi:MAG: hypothetical protein AAF485_23635 [Chloroflexota bacterium]